jgi:hypothetical protein
LDGINDFEEAYTNLKKKLVTIPVDYLLIGTKENEGVVLSKSTFGSS